MQYKVPQNIDMEDKIVGPFTMIQFLYMAVGHVIVYIIISQYGINVFSIILITPIELLTLALTFVKIQDQPFSHFLVSVLQYSSRPKRRLWKKIGSDPELTIVKTKQKKDNFIRHKEVTKSELEKLAQSLDTKGNQPKPEVLAAAKTIKQTTRSQDEGKDAKVAN